MLPKTLLLLLVFAHAASAGKAKNNSLGRTFGANRHFEPVELLDLTQLDQDGYISFINNSGSNPGFGVFNQTARHKNSSMIYNITDEAQLFLTGPLSTIFMPSFYTLVCLISVPLNTIAMITFTRHIRPMKPAVIYMLNLACADLLFALLLPFKIYYHFNGNDWTFGPVMCRVVTAAFYCNMYCSVLLIACISVDRQLAVVYPIDSLSWRRPRNAVIACVAMWILAVAGSVPLVIFEQMYYLKGLDISTCHDVLYMDDLHGFYKIYFSTICCLLFFLPLLITAVSYTRVIWSLRRVPHGVTGHSRRKARAVVMALTVLVLFVLCFTPTNCLLLVHYLQSNTKEKDSTYIAYLVFLCLGSLSCCLDPLIYYFGSSQCQRQLSGVLRCQKKLEFGKNTSASSDSSRTSTRTILTSSFKKNSKKTLPVTKIDSFQASLNSQYKKLLV